ncbi:MAG: sulfotransferase family 2 domain-containing protein [Pseudomonadota bacterium]
MISKRHKTIFVHIPKTAGQSVELVYLEDLGLKWRSILPWKNRSRLKLRRNIFRSRGPDRLAHLYAWEYVGRGHISAEDFEKFYKFAVVRDPYDRAVSEYNYRKRATGTLRDFFHSFTKDEMNDYRRHIVPQAYYVTEEANGKGDIIVDKIIKFESLNDELQDVFEKTLGRPHSLPKKNAPNEKTLDAKTLSREDTDYLSELYERDFAMFGYATR